MALRLHQPALAACLALLASATRSAADDSNFRPYVVGSRAAGIGGAFTALADDGSGPYYNPSGIAFVARSQLSISGSVYGVVSGSFANALGDGHDFGYSNLNTFPTATAGVWRLGDQPDRADVLSLGVFMPDAVNVDGRDTIVSKQNTFLLIDQVQTVWLGLTYAKRLGRLGLGVSAYGLLGGHISQQSLTAASSPGDFVIASARVDETTYGFVGALGLRWDATDELHLGASLFTPAVGWGTRRYFAAAAVAGAGSATGAPNSAIINEDGLHASPTQPLRVQGGVAWSHGPLTLSGDVIWLAPRDVLDDGDRAAQGLERHIVRNGVVNFAAGAEYVVAGRFPLRAGFFTDLAASPEPVATPAAGGGSDILNTGHVNRFGGTFSVGYLTEHTASALGVNLSGGSGTDLVPDNLDFSRFKPTRSTQLLVYVFLATAYEF